MIIRVPLRLEIRQILLLQQKKIMNSKKKFNKVNLILLKTFFRI
jgi:hypothetical protein